VLDKSVEYKEMMMRISAEDLAKAALPVLPKGFSFRFFGEGKTKAIATSGLKNIEEADAAHWARIETSVLEFDAEEEAAAHFAKEYLPHTAELKRRCKFVANLDNLPVATANAWFTESEMFGRQAVLHWVAVCPEFQGKGLGEAIVLNALECHRELEPGLPVWLHTQTWSHPAVRLYHKLGFRLMKTESFADNCGVKINKNEYAEAMKILKKIYPADLFAEMEQSAI